MLKGCRWQLRMGMGGVYALDFGAIMLTASAMGAASSLLAELLPDIEMILIRQLHDDAEPADQGSEG